VDSGSLRSSGATLALSWSVDGAGAVVALEGELDTETAAELGQVVERLLDEGVERLALDLERLEFLDSSGLRVLISTQRQLVARRGAVELRNPPPFARRLLEVTGLDGYFSLR